VAQITQNLVACFNNAHFWRKKKYSDSRKEKHEEIMAIIFLKEFHSPHIKDGTSDPPGY
jgi:hypothetical protein